MKIIDFNEIDLKEITYEKPEKIRGSFVSRALYNNEPIYIKTPQLKNISGLVQTETKTYIDLEFDDTSLHLYNFLSNLDENNINQINLNSEEWFNKEFPLDVIEDFYTTPLKHRNIPKLRLKMPILKGKNQCIIYNCDNNLIEDLTKGTMVITVLQLLGLRFLKQQVICEWVPIQMKTNDSEHLIKDSIHYLISDDFNTNENAEKESEVSEESIINESETQINNEPSLEESNKEEYLNYEHSVEEIKTELDKYKLSYEQKEQELNEFKNKLKSFLEIN